MTSFLKFIVFSAPLILYAAFSIAKGSTNPIQKPAKLSGGGSLAQSNVKTTQKAKNTLIERNIAQYPELTRESVFKNWTRQLIQIQKNLNRKNFKPALNQILCPQLEALKKKSYRDTKASKLYFKELIKFYGSITNYTLDHNYFYCLASFLNDPAHKWIKIFSKKVLPPKQKKKLLTRLDICYRESSEGNGDMMTQSLNLKPFKEFSEMDKKERKAYTEKLRESYLKIEKEKEENF